MQKIIYLKSYSVERESYMATSSITRNFVVSGKRQVEMFADAIEASANNRPIRISVSANFLMNPEDIIKLMEKRKNVSK